MKTKFCLHLAVTALAIWHPTSAQSQNINPAAGSTVLPNEGKAEGFVMINNRVHVVRQGVATPLQEEMLLRVTPGGIVGFDGMSRVISNNAMLSLDGRIVAAPQVQVMAPVLVTGADDPTPSSGSPHVVYGTNLSGLTPSRTVASRSGPRFISAKKSTAVKSRVSSTMGKGTGSKTVVAKKPSPSPVAATFPAFDDEVLQLPGLQMETPVAPNPTIDATSTMLYMTAAPTAAWNPESASIGASLEINPPQPESPASPAATPLPPQPPMTMPILPAAPRIKEGTP